MCNEVFLADDELLITDESVCVRVKCGKRCGIALAGKGKRVLKEEMNFFLWQFQRASIKLPRCVRALGFDRAI